MLLSKYTLDKDKCQILVHINFENCIHSKERGDVYTKK
jgi:hypothetical protein